MSANPPIAHRWPDDELKQDPSSQNYALTGKIMLASIIVLFVVVVVLVILHLYARWYLLRFHARRRNRRRRSTRIVFYVDNNRSVPAATASGLDASVLKSLPVFVYSPESHGSMPECAVCLSEFEDGETGRALPKCKHCFHTECIDMWFGSHSTCPLCRSPVEAGEPEMTILVENQESVPELGSSNSPSSQFQQDVDVRETTSSPDRMNKRVDVRINRNELAAGNELTEFQLSSPSQGFRSPGSRLLSLKRIMSISRKSPAMSPSSGVGSSSEPVSSESDLESARQELTQESSLPGSIS